MLFQSLLPSWSLSVGTFTILGMVAFFGSIAKTPLSTILMVSEMTGNCRLLVPSMWVCILAYVINRKVRLYRSQLPNRFEAPVHRGSMISGILRNLHAYDLLGTTTRPFSSLRSHTSALELARLSAETSQSVFPVVDDTGALVGVVSRRGLGPLLAAEQSLWQTLIVDDLLDADAVTARRDDTLHMLLRTMDTHHEDAIVVCDEHTPSHPVGVLGHNDIMDAYHAEIAAQR